MRDLFLAIGAGVIHGFLVLICGLISSTISILVVIAVVWLIELRSLKVLLQNSVVRYACGLSVPFSIVGAAIGFLSGLSQTAVMGSVVPAVLTFVAAAATYLYTKGKSEALVALVAMISIGLSLVAGTTTGSLVRPS